MPITITKTYEIQEIKDILIEEEKSYWEVLHDRACFSERATFYVKMAVAKVESRVTEQDLEDFINESSRMSLREWIESL